MTDATITFLSPHSGSSTRDLVARIRRIDGATAGLLSGEPAVDDKSATGDLLGAVVKIATEKAIGPLIELIKGMLVRDKRAKITVKLSDNSVFEFDSTNMPVDLERLSAAMIDLLRKKR